MGAASFRDRPLDAPPGKSSPQWVKRIAVAADPEVAVAAGKARFAELGDIPKTAESCTLASKQCELRIIRGVNTPPQSDEVYTVELLAISTLLNFAEELLPRVAIIQTLKATQTTFDPDPATPPQTKDAKSWRTVSDLAESMFANFKPQT